MDKGVYTLVFSNNRCSVPVGSLGTIGFRRGWLIYIGSARGPGGFARVRRHLRLSQERDRLPRWHVDRLLLSPCFTLRHVVCGTCDADLECALVAALGGEIVPSFGSSDCRCPSHLLHRSADPLEEVTRAMSSLGLLPRSVKHIKG